LESAENKTNNNYLVKIIIIRIGYLSCLRDKKILFIFTKNKISNNELY